MPVAAEQFYRYLAPSTYDPVERRLDLATDAEAETDQASVHPVYFDGFLTRPEAAAAGLLAVAAVARTRFWSPPNLVAAAILAADPVVTVGGGMLRFESFSPCCSVAARLDLLPGALDGRMRASGTTNVDFNQPVRAALARVAGLDPIHLAVGSDVTVTTLGGAIIERPVPLPDRWIRGFGEAQAAAARMRPVFTTTPAALGRLMHTLPRVTSTRATPIYATSHGDTIAITSSRRGVPLAGPQRLRVIERLLAHATTVYAEAAPDLEGGSVWRLDLPDARFTLALSADLGRGFSGEGALLTALAAVTDDDIAASAEIEWALHRGQDSDSPTSGHDAKTLGRAYALLAAAGRIGWDSAERAYFSRPLPFSHLSLAAPSAPRLVAARALLDARAVHIQGHDPIRAHVDSNGSTHHVRLGVADQGDQCTCPWFGQHRGTRGPCKHVLATRLHVASS